MPRNTNRPEKHPYRLTRAKRDAIKVLADYFCVPIRDAVVLLGKDPANDSHRRTVQTTLSLLHREGVAARLPYFDLDMDLPTRSYVYGLSDRGAKEFGGKTFDEHSERTLDHELAITRFHVALGRVFHEPRFRLHWHQSNIKRSVAPDAYFSITDVTKPEDRNTDHYFLEIERAKIGNIKDGEPSIIRKLAKYYEYYDTPKCAKEWGFSKFRVVAVVRNADKQYNLCERLAKQYAHRMFWITTEPHVRENVKGEIFRTPKDFTKVAYSFQLN